MYKLDINEYGHVKEIIEDCSCELSVFSTLEGNMPGQVFADKKKNPKSALVRTCETIALIGDPGNGEFNAYIKTHGLGFWDNFILDNEKWEEHLGEIHPNPYIKKYVRNKFTLTGENFIGDKGDLPAGYKMVKIDPFQLEKDNLRNKEPVLKWTGNWGTKRNFLDNGGGFMAITGEEIAGWSVTDCHLGHRAAMGIYVHENHRKRGLGVACASRTAAYLLEKGMDELEWLCIGVNKGSKAIAGKLGFVFDREYYSYTTYPPYENDSDLTSDQWEEQLKFYLPAFRRYPDRYDKIIKRIKGNIKRD